MISQFVDALRAKLREDITNYRNDTGNGVCKSFEDYQKLCGTIRGLELAQEHLMDLAKKVESDND